jgi:hypothetical protein
MRRLPWSMALSLLLLLQSGCLFDNTYVKEDRTDRRPRVARITSHVGGSHDCVLVHERLWYVGHGPSLLVIEGRGSRDARSETVGEVGTVGPLVNLAMWRDDLVGVIDGDAVLRWDVSVPRTPLLIDQVSSKALGVRPRCLDVVGDELYVSGDGGVVRASDGRRFLPDATRVFGVVPTSQGLAAMVGRRVVLLEDGRFIGAATQLIPLPEAVGIPGGFAFMLQGREGVTVGLMGPDVRERTGQVVRGTFTRIRLVGGRLWLIGDTEMVSWALRDGAMEDAVYTRVKGVRDIDALSENLFATVGSFGRATFRLHDDREGPGDEFSDVQREPGRLERSIFDGRRLLAGSDEGFWLYPIRGTPTLSDKMVELTQMPETKATLAWGTATIDRGQPVDGVPAPGEVRIEGPDGKAIWQAPDDAWISTVVAVDGDLWIGHGEGITVLRKGAVPATDGAEPAETRRQAEGELALDTLGTLRLSGPVIWLHPLRTGGGVAFVSRFGGMGVAELVPEDAPTASAVTR